MWSYVPEENSESGKVSKEIDRLKHKYLPHIVMTDDFDTLWNEYQEEYGKINTKAYLDDLTKEVLRRQALTEHN
ncbi:MAG: hypothetical protein HDT23_09045 [Ruminococcus sp.]|nr:hypothetical protein [Ruminococcus sp.]